MIHLVLGKQGSGKTLLLVSMAYQKYKEGKNIYSNIAFNFPYKKLSYKDVIKCKLTNGAVFIDEIHQLLPARASGRKINRKICDGFLSMVRKQGLEIYGTTQTRRKVDIRFREEADYEYFCEKYAFIDNEWCQVGHNQDLDRDIPINIKVKVMETSTFQIVDTFFHGNPYFDMYDTSQIINIIEVDDEKDLK